MKKIFIAMFLLSMIVVMTACGVQKISDVKNPDNVGDVVKVKGTVGLTVKLGSISGYTLEDETGTISVSTQNLPKEGDIVTAKGVLVRDTILGYYIKAD